jgi:hypothetical protein
MSIYTTRIALGKWDQRESLEYFPANAKVNGQRYNAFGVPITHATEEVEIRRPYKIDEAEERTYIMYDDDSNGDVPIFSVSKDEADTPPVDNGEGSEE